MGCGFHEANAEKPRTTKWEYNQLHEHAGGSEGHKLNDRLSPLLSQKTPKYLPPDLEHLRGFDSAFYVIGANPCSWRGQGCKILELFKAVLSAHPGACQGRCGIERRYGGCYLTQRTSSFFANQRYLTKYISRTNELVIVSFPFCLFA